MNKLVEINEAIDIINSGKCMSIAGNERVLGKLPKGNWIGGTTPYFMDQKGAFDLNKVFVNEICTEAVDFKVQEYDEHNLLSLTNDRFKNGYSLLILPTFKQVHFDYAFKASQLPNLYDAPIIGWMAGTNLEHPTLPKTINGLTGEVFENKGVAIHVELPDHLVATLEVVNIHREMENSPTIQFLENAFHVKECLINGEKQNLSDYLTANNIDTKAPLVTDYSGAKINVSFKEINKVTGEVDFYAPIFEGREYRFGEPISDYVDEFDKNMPQFNSSPEFCCNCILNYVFGDLEGKFVGASGPITFGEIGYILLNQTFTYLSIHEA